MGSNISPKTFNCELPKALNFMTEKVNIFWFRQDLRIADNPALTHAAESGTVLAVYILDQNDQGDHGPEIGRASCRERV